MKDLIETMFKKVRPNRQIVMKREYPSIKGMVKGFKGWYKGFKDIAWCAKQKCKEISKINMDYVLATRIKSISEFLSNGAEQVEAGVHRQWPGMIKKGMKEQCLSMIKDFGFSKDEIALFGEEGNREALEYKLLERYTETEVRNYPNRLL